MSDSKPSQSRADERAAAYARLDGIEQTVRRLTNRVAFLELMSGYEHVVTTPAPPVAPEDIIEWPIKSNAPVQEHWESTEAYLRRLKAQWPEARVNLQEVVEGRDALRDMKLARLRDVQRELAMLIEQL